MADLGSAKQSSITASEQHNSEVDDRLVYIEPSGSDKLLPMTRRAASLSVYLQDIIELIDQQAFQEDNHQRGRVSNNDNWPIIPLRHHPACNSSTMENIIKWCEYHCDDPKLNNENIYEDFDEDDETDSKRTRNLEEMPSYWDRRFLSDIAGDEDPINGWRNRGDLYDLLIAAHFLQINPIVEIGGKFVCQAIREKSVEQVRNFLGIINDFREEELRSMSADNDFAFR